MNTIDKAIIAEFSELVYDMMICERPFDMEVVRVVSGDFMQGNGLEFKAYTDLLVEYDGNGFSK